VVTENEHGAVGIFRAKVVGNFGRQLPHDGLLLDKAPPDCPELIVALALAPAVTLLTVVTVAASNVRGAVKPLLVVCGLDAVVSV
jgi:hypothetical protein